MRPDQEGDRRQFGSVTVSNEAEDKKGMEGEDKTPEEPKEDDKPE